MVKLIFETFERHEVTDSMLEEATTLFNENYGIWAGKIPVGSARPKPGTRVKLSKNRLRSQCLPQGVDCSYARVTVEDRLVPVGHVFACRWHADDQRICWITQLVVHKDYRKRGLAVGLMNSLRQADDSIYGIMSSHPAACLAAAKAFGSNGFSFLCDLALTVVLGSIDSIDLSLIHDKASKVIQQSPVEYVRSAAPRGKLFTAGDTSGAVSSVFSNFFVDHNEPIEVLQRVKAERKWPLGELLDGHEFLLMVKARSWN